MVFCVTKVWEPPSKDKATHFQTVEMGGFALFIYNELLISSEEHFVTVLQGTHRRMSGF